MNNSTNSSTWEQKSLQDLDAQLLGNIGIFVVALLTILSNLGVLFGLYKGRKIKFNTHHYKLIIHMSSLACAQAFFLFIVFGVIRLVATAFRIPSNMSLKNCGLLLLFMEVSMLVDAYNVLVLAIDRMAAVTLPFRYKVVSTTKQYKIITYGLPWLLGLADASAKFFSWTKDFMEQNLSVCLIANTRTTGYQSYKYYRSLVIGSLTILLYLAGIVFVKYKIYMDKNNATQLKKELGFKVMVTCGTDAFVYTCTYFLSQVYGSILLLSATPQARVVLSPLAVIMVLAATTPRFFILYYLSDEFRKIIKKLIFTENKIFLVWGKSMVAGESEGPTRPFRTVDIQGVR